MMYKLTVYVPDAAVEAVKSALFSAGAGRQGCYEHCAWAVLGEGQFRPLPGANPFLGQVACLEKLPEWRLEVLVDEPVLPPVLRALRQAHPYEEPAFDVVALVDTRALEQMQG